MLKWAQNYGQSFISSLLGSRRPVAIPQKCTCRLSSKQCGGVSFLHRLGLPAGWWWPQTSGRCLPLSTRERAKKMPSSNSINSSPSLSPSLPSLLIAFLHLWPACLTEYPPSHARPSIHPSCYRQAARPPCPHYGFIYFARSRHPFNGDTGLHPPERETYFSGANCQELLLLSDASIASG